MSFERPSLNTIIQRVETDITSRLTDGIPLLRNSVLKILARAIAGAIHLLYGFLQFLGNEAILVDRAFGIWLDRHAFIWGLTRKPATFANGNIIFTGVEATFIPSGTILIRQDGVEFITTLEGTIAGGFSSTVCQCRIAGVIGNTGAGIFLTVVTPITGIDDPVEVDVTEIIGGTDIESDTDLRNRILFRIQNPPAGGSVSDYIIWATSIEGVFKAFVFPGYYGAGSVAVVIIGDDFDNPDVSAPIIAEVQAYIETVRPVTANVIVSTVVPTPVNFEFDDTSNDVEIQNAITAGIKQLLQDESSPGGEVILSHVGQVILQNGAPDYVINDPLANVSLTGFQYPVVGTVVYNPV